METVQSIKQYDYTNNAGEYVLATGQAAANRLRILHDVYGIDFFHPPPEAHGTGMIPSGFSRNVWERYSTERWQEIRRAYNVTQVLTDNNWTLRLPIVAQNSSYLLYEIPE